MQLYNTLTRSKSEFTPITPSEVKLYTCGPTVYDYAHIGNLRSYIFEDILRRTLERNYSVKHVMNLTDVGHLESDADEGEDKLEKGAAREGKTVWEVADFYIEVFTNDISKLNIIPAHQIVRATSKIEQQIAMVKILIDKGYAYTTEQAVYFDVSKDDDYGKLTGQKLSEKEVGVRSEVVTDTQKRNPQDFALWFFTTGHFKDHTMHWPSPWGEGFPGWHIECSAIIKDTLGDTIDIHTGGVDHIGTHHTNEIAQSESANDKPLASFWVHGEFMLVDSSKMSKSLGNYFTISDIISKGYNPLAFRLLCLQAHYRSELNFTWSSLRAAENFLTKLGGWADLQFQSTPGPNNPDFTARLRGTLTNMAKALDDDLSTPAAIAALSQLVDWMQKAPLPERDVEEFKAALISVDQMLGLNLADRNDINGDIRAIIEERETARLAEDFKQADVARKKLSGLGVLIDDTPYGPRWKRKSAI